VEVNRADAEALLRVPGIGVLGARKILTARRCGPLTFEGLKRLGIVLKRAQYFITCSGRMLPGLRCSPEGVYRRLAGLEQEQLGGLTETYEQLDLFSGNVG
jgi:predicted DNA-binding helix-hairpin-helix protein